MANDVVETVDDPSQLKSARLKRIGASLKTRFDQYKKDRRTAEQQWIKNLRQYLGEWDPEVDIPPNRSRAYPKLTRQKVQGMVSRLMSLLFPEGESNWGVDRSPRPSVDADTLTEILAQWMIDHPEAGRPEPADVEAAVGAFAAEAAEIMSTKIEDQLVDTAQHGQMDYPTLARKVILSATKLSMGVLKGPMTVEDTGVRYDYNDQGELEIMEEQRYRPYFEYVPLFDYFPDMNAKTFEQMDGEFHRHVMSKHQLLKLAERPEFDGDKIRAYVRANQEGDFSAESYDTDLSSMNASLRPDGKLLKGKYEVIEYWGSVYRTDLEGQQEGMDPDEEIVGTVWMLGDQVVKAAKSPFPEGTRMFHQFVFEEDEINLTGQGLPQIMRDSQMGMANATRMMLDNAAAVCGPMAEVNIDLLAHAGKKINFQAFEVVYRIGEGAMATGQAVRDLSFNSHLSELLALVDHFKRVADEETFVSSATDGGIGNTPGEAARTQGNMSMILGNTSLPFRDIVRNYDTFTVSVIHALIQWNRIFDGESALDGDLRPLAYGSTTLMAKEVRAYALDNLATTLTDDERAHIEMRELARHRVKVRDLPESLLRPEAEVRAELEQQAQLQQQMEELQMQMQQVQLSQLQADVQQTAADTQQTQADVAETFTSANFNRARIAETTAKAEQIQAETGIDLETAILELAGYQPAPQPTQQQSQGGQNRA